MSAIEQLDKMERQAHHYYNEAIRNMRLFLETALEIQKSGLWKEKAETWDTYCAQYMPRKASTIRVYNSVDALAELLENVIEVTPDWSLVHKLHKVIPADDRRKFAPLTWHMATLENETPTEGQFDLAYNLLLERERTGVIYLDAEVMTFNRETLQAAYRDALVESGKRHQAHILAGAQTKQSLRYSGAVEDLQLRDGHIHISIVLDKAEVDIYADQVGRKVRLYIDDSQLEMNEEKTQDL